MSTLNATDLLLVNRGGQSYNVEYQNMSTLLDTDLLLVNRGGQSYKLPASNLDTLTPPIINFVTLTENNPDVAPRFTDQTFTAGSNITNGVPNSTKYIDAYVEGMMYISGKFDAPLLNTTDTNVSYTASISGMTNAAEGSCYSGVSGGQSQINGNSIQVTLLNTNTTVNTPIPNAGSGGEIKVWVWCNEASYVNFTVQNTDGQTLAANTQITPNPSLVQMYQLAPTGANSFVNQDIRLIALQNTSSGQQTVITKVEIGGKVLLDGTVPTLNFAGDTDMSFLENGDTVTQSTQFSGVLESSTSGTSYTYSNQVTGTNQETYLFDGDLQQYAFSNASNDWIAWKPGTLGNTGPMTSQKWGIWVAQNGATFEWELIFTDGDRESQTFNSGNGWEYWTGTIKPVTTMQLRQTTGTYNTVWGGIKDNGAILMDGVPIWDLTFPAGTDMAGVTSGTPISSSGGAVTGIVMEANNTTITVGESNGTWQPGTTITGEPNETSSTVLSIDGTDVTVEDGTWENGLNVTGPEKNLPLQSARRYLEFDSNGDVSSLLANPQSPAWSSNNSNPSLTLTFPSTFPTGETPDQTLTKGCTLTVAYTATNEVASSGPVVATVQPDDGVAPLPISGLVSLYTGNGNAENKVINGIDCTQSDVMLWLKSRSITYYHFLWDNVTTTPPSAQLNYLNTNSTSPYNGMGDTTGGISWNTDGFTINADQSGASTNWNGTNQTFVGWCFQRAPEYFDIVSYAGPGNGSINHGLNTEPGMIIVKNTNQTSTFLVQHEAYGAGNAFQLNTPQPVESTTQWDSQAPTSTQFFQNGSVNTGQQGDNYVAYLFAKDSAYCKCGSYSGSGGTVEIDTGWRAQWILIKNATSSTDWAIFDDKRGATSALRPNTQDSTQAYGPVIFNETQVLVSPGDQIINTSGDSYIYLAIAASATTSMTQAQFDTFSTSMDEYPMKECVGHLQMEMERTNTTIWEIAARLADDDYDG